MSLRARFLQSQIAGTREPATASRGAKSACNPVECAKHAISAVLGDTEEPTGAGAAEAAEASRAYTLFSAAAPRGERRQGGELARRLAAIAEARALAPAAGASALASLSCARAGPARRAQGEPWLALTPEEEVQGFRRQELRCTESGGAPREPRAPWAAEGPPRPTSAGWLGGLMAPRGSVAVGGTPWLALDTETTGLDPTSGTLAFLVGVAWVDGEDLVIRQWTLLRLSAEGAMLRDLVACVDALAGPATALVTYNGVPFDLPLLRTRCRRHRVAPGALAAVVHVDLLPLARRLWGPEEPNCRLTTLERSRLGLRRCGDIPGRAIPAAFWRWLAAPEEPAAVAEFAAIHAHHRADLQSLPALGAALAAALERPTSLVLAVRVARLEVARGRPCRAFEILRPWLPEEGEGAAALAGGPERGKSTPAGGTASLMPEQREAWGLAAGLLRRRGEVAAAAALWSQICRRWPGDPEAHEALAKLLEHRLREPRGALAVARASREPSPGRLSRLERKVAKCSRRAPESV